MGSIFFFGLNKGLDFCVKYENNTQSSRFLLSKNNKWLEKECKKKVFTRPTYCQKDKEQDLKLNQFFFVVFCWTALRK